MEQLSRLAVAVRSQRLDLKIRRMVSFVGKRSNKGLTIGAVCATFQGGFVAEKRSAIASITVWTCSLKICETSRNSAPEIPSETLSQISVTISRSPISSGISHLMRSLFRIHTSPKVRDLVNRMGVEAS
jgi:hypothetical protein